MASVTKKAKKKRKRGLYYGAIWGAGAFLANWVGFTAIFSGGVSLLFLGLLLPAYMSSVAVTEPIRWLEAGGTLVSPYHERVAAMVFPFFSIFFGAMIGYSWVRLWAWLVPKKSGH